MSRDSYCIQESADLRGWSGYKLVCIFSSVYRHDTFTVYYLGPIFPILTLRKGATMLSRIQLPLRLLGLNLLIKTERRLELSTPDPNNRKEFNR